jgi:transcriptional regulator with XRE-family HTH domain
MANIGNRLLQLRKAKNLSQNELSNLAGVSREMIGKYERDEAVPALDVAINIAKVLDSSLDYLVGDSPSASFNNDTIKLIKEIELLNPSVKEKLFFLANAIIRDAKAQQAYS